MIISIIFILLVTLGIGLPPILLICPKINRVSVIGLSFPIGIGIFTLIMFFSNLIGIRFSLPNESLILLLFLIPLVFLLRERINKFYIDLLNNLKELKLSAVEKVMLGGLIFLILTSFINTFYWPVSMWDSVVLYDFRGHVFASTGFLKGALTSEYYYSYPLLTSLAHTIIYLGGGKYPQFIYSLFYLSLGLSFFGFLREFVSRKAGIFFTMLLMITGPLFYHSLFSYTNLTYTIYVSLGAILIHLWSRKKDFGYLILSAIMMGLSVHVRATEPFWLAALLVVVMLSIYRKNIFGFLVYPLILLPVRQIWVFYQRFISQGALVEIANKMEFRGILMALFDWDKWFQIGDYLYKHVVIPWGPIFLAFVLAATMIILKRQKNNFLIFIITLLFIGVLIAGVFIFSIYLDYWNRIGDATERLSMLFYPLFIYSIALVVSKIKDSE